MDTCINGATPGPITKRFSPYDDNGGSTAVIAGEDFVVLASDARLSRGHSILSRNQTKCFKLTSKTMLCAVGCWADVLTLTKLLEARLTSYSHEHLETMSTTAIAQLLSTLLYYRRFFPYYIHCSLVGLDNEGKGVVYTYDPVGCIEKVGFDAGGASMCLVQPFLDNQIGGFNMKKDQVHPLTQDFVKEVIYDCFISASERDIHTGDACIMYTITKDGIKEESFPLRKD